MEMPKIKVANFEGPFDLLLHLIKKHEMDIYNVEIYKITNQYLQYLDEMKVMDLEITSEFVVVAATLIEIKSKKLLPKVKVVDESEEDIEKNLMEKLIEYKKIKLVSEFFKDKYVNSGEVYSKKPEIIIEEELDKKPVEDSLKNISLLELYNIYNRIIESYYLKQNVENVIQKKIYIDKYKLEDKMDYVLEKFKKDNIFSFESIINESECKLEVVVTFLALLELIKLRMITIYQDESFGNILVKRRGTNE
ncbi:segregation/condensation protein A [Clostridium sp.]|uniref:segregation/condensation protein A n=1 Tax=Clostridium sp. TaxID=1506 RepID=UPI003F4042E9